MTKPEKKRINPEGELDYIRDGEVIATVRKMDKSRWQVIIPYIAEKYVVGTQFKAEYLADLRLLS